MKVYKITEEEALLLTGQKMSNGCYYNTEVRDKNGNIIISREQYNHCGLGVEIDYEPIELEEEE